jgi:hypothetical protein
MENKKTDSEREQYPRSAGPNGGWQARMGSNPVVSINAKVEVLKTSQQSHIGANRECEDGCLKAGPAFTWNKLLEVTVPERSRNEQSAEVIDEYRGGEYPNKEFLAPEVKQKAGQ